MDGISVFLNGMTLLITPYVLITKWILVISKTVRKHDSTSSFLTTL